MNFPQFLEQKYLDWRRSEGEKRSIQDFASYLGIRQQVLSHYMNGVRKKPTSDNVRLIAAKLGFEVYDVLGLPRPDEDLAYITQHWNDVSEEFRRKFRKEVEKQLAHTNEEPKRLTKNRRVREGS